MQFYRFSVTTPDGETVLAWEPTFLGARMRARTYIHRRDEITVDLVDVLVNKDGVYALLQGDIVVKGPVTRSWTITARGGLKLEPVQEA